MSKLPQNQSPVAKKNFTFPIGAILKPKSIENRSRAAECGLENNNRLKFSKNPPVVGGCAKPLQKRPDRLLQMHWIAIAD
jgi:hypothetical protein